MKTITFILPKPSLTPAGGYKVTYEYANMLIKDGYNVNIAYPSRLNNIKSILSMYNCLKNYIKFYLLRYGIVKKWFGLDPKIRELMIFEIDNHSMPISDVYVATSVETAMQLDSCKLNKHNVYLIQHYESWIVSEEQLVQTYCNSMTKVVISKWLYNIVSRYDSNCRLIPNGFDFKVFQTTVSPQCRNRFNIVMLYHNIDWKGCDDCFAALDIVKKKYAQLNVTLFGVPKRPKELPNWYHYVQTPAQHILNEIYNNASIFIGASWSEGWGLTIGEAMICSCAVACTDNDGYKEMAIDNETALLSSIKNPSALANNIIRLIEDDDLRIKLAMTGHSFIKNFSWSNSYIKFKAVVNSLV